MKKMKFMMPALAIASTAAAITPFVTSCNKSGASVTFQYMNKGKDVPYKLKLKPAAKKEYDSASGFAADVIEIFNKDPNVFFDDFLYQWGSQQPVISGVNDAFVTVSNVSATSFLVSEAVKFGFMWLSFDVSVEGDVAKAQFGYDGNFACKIGLHNLPYCVYVESYSQENAINGYDISLVPLAKYLTNEQSPYYQYAVAAFALTNFSISEDTKFTYIEKNQTKTYLDSSVKVDDMSILKEILGSGEPKQLFYFTELVEMDWDLNYFQNATIKL